MAADFRHQQENAHEFHIHHRNYEGFIKALKWSTAGVAIITAAVLVIIAS